MDSKVQVVLITGFLGSGKTTVLNDTLSYLRSSRVGLVVNDWGMIGVDGSLLRHTSGTEVIELSGGQIFCSCLAGNFLDALDKLVNVGSEIILVETSGLAKPATLREVIVEAERRTTGRLAYSGLVCVVDALRFTALREVAIAVDEQIAYADRFIVTKVDIADEGGVQEIVTTLRRLRPTVPIAQRVGKPVELDAVLPHAAVQPTACEIPSYDRKWAGWGLGGRPKAETLLPCAPVRKTALEAFLRAVASRTFRIKGFVAVTDQPGPVLVDCVEHTVALRSARSFSHSVNTPEGLTIIWKKPPRTGETVFRLFSGVTGVGAHKPR